MNGYRHYWGVPEWYQLRTPFSQWFTKSFAASFSPFMDSLGMEALGHAPSLSIRM